MCRRVACRKCGRPTWAGCGLHIEQALAGVPPAERCQCPEKPSKGGQTDGQSDGRSWLSRIFGG